MNIEILGDGCSKCRQLKKRVHEAVEELDLEVTVESVSDAARLAELQTLSLPMLIIDGRAYAAGGMKASEIKKLLQGGD